MERRLAGGVNASNLLPIGFTMNKLPWHERPISFVLNLGFVASKSISCITWSVKQNDEVERVIPNSWELKFDFAYGMWSEEAARRSVVQENRPSAMNYLPGTVTMWESRMKALWINLASHIWILECLAGGNWWWFGQWTPWCCLSRIGVSQSLHAILSMRRMVY